MQNETAVPDLHQPWTEESRQYARERVTKLRTTLFAMRNDGSDEALQDVTISDGLLDLAIRSIEECEDGHLYFCLVTMATIAADKSLEPRCKLMNIMQILVAQMRQDLNRQAAALTAESQAQRAASSPQARPFFSVQSNGRA